MKNNIIIQIPARKRNATFKTLSEKQIKFLFQRKKYVLLQEKDSEGIPKMIKQNNYVFFIIARKLSILLLANDGILHDGFNQSGGNAFYSFEFVQKFFSKQFKNLIVDSKSAHNKWMNFIS